jgi:hypothetical protein
MADAIVSRLARIARQISRRCNTGFSLRMQFAGAVPGLLLRGVPGGVIVLRSRQLLSRSARSLLPLN